MQAERVDCLDVASCWQVVSIGRASAARSWKEERSNGMTTQSETPGPPATFALWHRPNSRARWQRLFVGTPEQCADEFHQLVTVGKRQGHWLTRPVAAGDPNVRERASA